MKANVQDDFETPFRYLGRFLGGLLSGLGSATVVGHAQLNPPLYSGGGVAADWRRVGNDMDLLILVYKSDRVS
jgi:hypothetical protein